MSRFKERLFVEDLLEGRFKTYDSWLESPYHETPYREEPDEDVLYRQKVDKEVLDEIS